MLVRDSKLGDESEVVVFEPAAWARFIDAIKGGLPIYRIRQALEPLSFTDAEMDAFQMGAGRGEFDQPGADWRSAAPADVDPDTETHDGSSAATRALSQVSGPVPADDHPAASSGPGETTTAGVPRIEITRDIWMNAIDTYAGINQEDAKGVEVGGHAVLVDAASGLEWDAEVVRIEHGRGIVYFEVAWKSVRDLDATAVSSVAGGNTTSDDVPALLAEIERLRAEVETKTYVARKNRDHHWRAVDELEKRDAKLAEVTRQRDEAQARSGRMRHVVEEAEAYIAAVKDGGLIGLATCKALEAAVDRYQGAGDER